MKIGLIGYGKMGKATEKAALERGHEVPIYINSENIDFSLLEDVDVCIDFTAPDAVWKNLQEIAVLKKNVIIGTTGWDKELPKAYQLARRTPFGFLYSPNFSIGTYILKKLIYQCRELTMPFNFDIAGVEMHHNQKKDKPSGTVKELFDIPFVSVRCGDLKGIHQVIFNSENDTIELIHRATSRMGFARGAVNAAEWLEGKMGVFTFDDFMKDTLCNSKALLQH